MRFKLRTKTKAGIAFVRSIIRLGERPDDVLESFRRGVCAVLQHPGALERRGDDPERNGSTSKGPSAEYPFRKSSLTSSYDASAAGELKIAFVPSVSIS